MNRRGIVWLAVSFAALSAPPIPSALAQSGIIRVVIGTAPGGAIDPYARMIAEHMSRTLGQPIMVENKPGASGSLAAEYVANAPADGTILWLGTQAFTEINPNAFPNARWSIDQFRPIIRGVEAPLVFIVHPSVPADTFAEFLTWAKANKGKLSYSSYQSGTPSHFLGFQMNEKFDLDLTHVPYRGSEAAHADLAVKEKLEAQGFEVSGETGPQLKSEIKQQVERWGCLVKASGFSIEDRGSTQ
jgi:tripartite-type tricarboxylate transporter receptor subunit TctC